MADFHTHVVVQPSIPNACMTPLERWLLEALFESEADGDEATYFFASDSIEPGIAIDEELQDVLRGEASPLAAALRRAIDAASAGDVWLDLDSLGGHVAVFQAIIARHRDKLPFVTLETAYTCSNMRPDGFGGRAELITAGEVR